jgi:hypothetical protein
MPTVAASADVVITAAGILDFGRSITVGDWNQDGRDDMAVGATGYNSYQGRVYLFYGDGTIPTTAATADFTITGEASGYFGWSLATGDFDQDGSDDLAVGAEGYNSNQGRVYIFNNDGTMPSSAGAADATISGEATLDRLGYTLASGDFNNDGRTDLAVCARGHTSETGRTYLYYGATLVGSLEAATSSDVHLSGESAGDYYGWALAAGDVNNDGTIDLLVGARGYNTDQGRLYFYTTNDRVITGDDSQGHFGSCAAVGDLNSDGINDLAVGATGYDVGNNDGRAYIFYGGRKATTSVSGADEVIDGETLLDEFGCGMAIADLDNDGDDDLVIGGLDVGSDGKVYIFENDGDYPSSAADAETIIDGETGGRYFGRQLDVGDFNNDGATDLVVADETYDDAVSNEGRVYIFYNDGAYPAASAADVKITGSSPSLQFGFNLSAGDYDGDGDDDLVVSRNSGSGTYVFYNDGSIPTNTASADASLSGLGWSYFETGDFNADGVEDLAVGTGLGGAEVQIYYGGSVWSGTVTPDVSIESEGTIESFGSALVSGDLNNDGKDDLVVGASGYDVVSNEGVVYVFYNDGLYPEQAVHADIKVLGPKENGHFASYLASGDLNGNGVDDLVVGSYLYDIDATSNEGRVYILMSEAAAEHISTYKIRGDVKIRGNVIFH